MVKKFFGKIKLKILIPIIAVAVLAVIIVIVFLAGRSPGVTCEQFTPLALQQLESIAGEKAVWGETCQITSSAFLMRLIYSSSSQAERAKMGLVSGAAGEKKNIEGVNWIISEGDSSLFLQKQERVAVLVLLNTVQENAVKAALTDISQKGF